MSISEMARMVGLSRQRFSQLVKAGMFPQPLYDLTTRRPFYDPELQQSCQEVRRRNCGINGQVVLFYTRRQAQPTPKQRPVKQEQATDQNTGILDGLKSLGLVQTTSPQVGEVVRELYPQGTDKLDLGEVIRAVFLHLRRKNSGDKVGGK